MTRISPLAAIAAVVLLAVPALGAAGEAGGDGGAGPPSKDEPGPDGWFDARSSYGAFSVRLPGRFVDSHRTGAQQGGEAVDVDSVQTIVQVSFGAVQTWQAVCVVHLERPPTAEAAFAEATNEHETNGFLRWRKRSSIDGHPALDFAVSDGKRALRSRIIVIGKRVCTAEVNYPVFDPVSDADSEKFLASFKPR